MRCRFSRGEKASSTMALQRLVHQALALAAGIQRVAQVAALEGPAHQAGQVHLAHHAARCVGQLQPPPQRPAGGKGLGAVGQGLGDALGRGMVGRQRRIPGCEVGGVAAVEICHRIHLRAAGRGVGRQQQQAGGAQMEKGGAHAANLSPQACTGVAATRWARDAAPTPKA
jgi:hypothetical protein